MRVLVLTISAGQGHNQTAGAIHSYLKEQGVEVSLIDTYKYFNSALSSLVEKGYLLSTRYIPLAYGKLYDIEQARDHNGSKVSMVKIGTKLVTRQFAKFISGQEPDVIIGTHIFAVHLMSVLKSKGFITANTIGVLTDFTVHPFWETANIDYYVTPTHLLNNQMVKKGIDLNKILPYGIPIDLKFSKKTDKKTARSILEIDDKTTIFIMTGSMGFGNIIKYISQLDRLDLDFQIVSVCGNNKHMKKRIDDLINSFQIRKKVYNFGYVNNVHVIMDASDYMVTKPGGITVSEALAKGLPLILIDPIPGQEDRNTEFLLNNGLAIAVSNTFPIDEALYQIMTNNTRNSCLSTMVKEIGKPFASKELGDFIIGLGDENQNS